MKGPGWNENSSGVAPAPGRWGDSAAECRASMAFESEKAQLAGCSAWLRGELDLAVERLEAALRARPGAPDALYALARALSERGELDRALLTIAEAISRDPAGEAGPLFRAIILHDHEGGPGAREALAQ